MYLQMCLICELAINHENWTSLNYHMVIKQVDKLTHMHTLIIILFNVYL